MGLNIVKYVVKYPQQLVMPDKYLYKKEWGGEGYYDLAVCLIHG